MWTSANGGETARTITVWMGKRGRRSVFLCPAVRLSVRHIRVFIYLLWNVVQYEKKNKRKKNSNKRWLKLSWNFFCLSQVAHHSSFWAKVPLHNIPSGTITAKALNKCGFRRSYSHYCRPICRIYLGNGTRYAHRCYGTLTGSHRYSIPCRSESVPMTSIGTGSSGQRFSTGQVGARRRN